MHLHDHIRLLLYDGDDWNHGCTVFEHYLNSQIESISGAVCYLFCVVSWNYE
jgi:hypothetical protein